MIRSIFDVNDLLYIVSMCAGFTLQQKGSVQHS